MQGPEGSAASGGPEGNGRSAETEGDEIEGDEIEGDETEGVGLLAAADAFGGRRRNNHSASHRSVFSAPPRAVLSASAAACARQMLTLSSKSRSSTRRRWGNPNLESQRPTRSPSDHGRYSSGLVATAQVRPTLTQMPAPVAGVNRSIAVDSNHKQPRE